MGRFLAIVLALSGCGRLGFDDMGPGDPASVTVTGTMPNGTQPTGQLKPNTCASSTFAKSLVAGVDDLDLAIGVTPAGPTLVGADKAGGNLMGLELGGEFATAGTVKVVRAGNFAAASATYVDGLLFAAGVSGTTVVVHSVPTGLAGATQLAQLDGMFVSKETMMLASGDRITPTSCSAGLTVNPYDASWQPTSSQLSVNTNQSTGIASTPFGTDAMTVWSTSDECHIERVIKASMGSGAMQSWPCTAPRIAANVPTNAGVLVFEGTDGIRFANFTSGNLDATSSLIAPGGSSPRVVFDGARYWIAYLDSTNALAVGTFDGVGAFQSTTTDATAKHDAFELALVNGNVWLAATSKSTVEARMICLD